MNEVRMWVAAVCLTVLSAALLRMVCPEGGFSRLMRIILGAFVLCALLQPLWSLKDAGFGAEAGYEEAMAQAESYEEQVEDRSLQMMESSLKSLIAAELSKKEIPFEKISISMDTGEDGRIVIRQTQVTLPYGQNADEVKTLLRETLGLETEVTADENR